MTTARLHKRLNIGMIVLVCVAVFAPAAAALWVMNTTLVSGAHEQVRTTTATVQRELKDIAKRVKHAPMFHAEMRSYLHHMPSSLRVIAVRDEDNDQVVADSWLPVGDVTGVSSWPEVRDAQDRGVSHVF